MGAEKFAGQFFAISKVEAAGQNALLNELLGQLCNIALAYARYLRELAYTPYGRLVESRKGKNQLRLSGRRWLGFCALTSRRPMMVRE